MANDTKQSLFEGAHERVKKDIKKLMKQKKIEHEAQLKKTREKKSKDY
jgi:hypothetical protein